MKHIKYSFILAICLLIASSLQGQSFNKLNTDLILKLKKSRNLSSSSERVPLLVKGDLTVIRNFTLRQGSNFKFAIRDMASIELPISKIQDLAALRGVECVEWYKDEGTALSDFMTKNNNIDSVHHGFGPLPKGYKGEGVIVATIDLGLDWKHGDFLNADSSSRVLYLWEQGADTTSNVATYNYGYEWTKADIDNDSIFHDPYKYNGHGTQSTGIAAGNGLAADTLTGVAPKADIIHVDIDLGNSFTTHFVDAVHYIVSKAEALNKPVAINSSVGSYFGSHDAKDLASQMVEALLDEKKGRVLCQAAGNGGQVNFHVGYNITQDTSFTWYAFSTHAQVQSAYINLYADKARFDTAYFSVSLIDPSNFQRKAQTIFYNLASLSFADSSYVLIRDTLRNSASQIIGTTEMYVEFYENLYDITIIGYPASNSDYWEVASTGRGRIDGWNSQGIFATSNFIETGLPTAAVLPRIVHYKKPDNLQTLISRWACSAKIITVGLYQNRSGYVDYNGNTQVFTPKQHEYTAYCSRGPSRHGLTKPNIITSGAGVFSAQVTDILDVVRVSYPQYVYQTGWHTEFGGTSAATPIATGAAALYLQMHPHADYKEVMKAFQDYAVVDTFLTKSQYGNQFPSPDWGYGKLNLYHALVGNLIYGCKDSTAQNYNPLADIATDTLCSYSTSTLDPRFEVKVSIAPNPSNGQAVISYELGISSLQNAAFEIRDLLGKKLSAQPITQASGKLSLELQTFPKGMYFCSLSHNGQIIHTQKLLIH